MSLIQSPKVVGVGKGFHAASFSFNWADEPVVPFSVAGYNSFEGAQYDFNVVALGIAANIGQIKSLRFSQRFANPPIDNTTETDGALIIYVPGTQEVTTISPLAFAEDETVAGMYPRVSGVIPVVTHAPSHIRFCKCAQSGTTLACHGELFVTAYDFDVASFIQSGFSGQ